MKTMICLILDRSGSMAGRQGDVIGGVNKFIEEQKLLPDPASIALVRFDSWYEYKAGTSMGGVTRSQIERFRHMQPLAECQDLTTADYVPRGGTPLLDAVGQTLLQLDADWKLEKPDRCIVVIATDGIENESRQFTKGQIKEMIQAREASGLWAIIYLGANVDAFNEAHQMGISAGNTASYESTERGTYAVMDSMSVNVSSMRASGSMHAPNLGGHITEEGEVTKKPTAPAAPAEAPVPRAAWTPPGTPWAPPAA